MPAPFLAQPHRTDFAATPELSGLNNQLALLWAASDQMFEELYRDVKFLSDNATASSTSSSSGTGSWSLVNHTVAGGAASYTVSGLQNFSEIMCVVRLIVLSASGEVRLIVSSDGTTFLNSSGNYISVAGSGAESNQSDLAFYSGATTAARSGVINIEGFNIAQPNKVVRSNFFSADGINLRFIPTSSALQAVKFICTGGGNLNSGDLYVWGR